MPAKHLLTGISLVCLFVLVLPLPAKAFFFRLPAFSSSFDCDDGTLLMRERFFRVGIETRFDRQHYEGYLVSHEQLIKRVEHDNLEQLVASR